MAHENLSFKLNEWPVLAIKLGGLTFVRRRSTKFGYGNYLRRGLMCWRLLGSEK